MELHLGLHAGDAFLAFIDRHGLFFRLFSRLFFFRLLKLSYLLFKFPNLLFKFQNLLLQLFVSRLLLFCPFGLFCLLDLFKSFFYFLFVLFFEFLGLFFDLFRFLLFFFHSKCLW